MVLSTEYLPSLRGQATDPTAASRNRPFSHELLAAPLPQQERLEDPREQRAQVDVERRLLRRRGGGLVRRVAPRREVARRVGGVGGIVGRRLEGDVAAGGVDLLDRPLRVAVPEGGAA